MLFPCIRVFSQKKTSVTGQHLALWLMTDLLFSLFGGSYFTPFRWVLLFQNNSAVIHKVAQCVIPMQIRYIYSYISSTISGLDHCTCFSYLVLGCVCLVNRTRSLQDISQSQFLTRKKLAHCSTQNTINSKHPSQNSPELAHITIYNCKKYFQTDSL